MDKPSAPQQETSKKLNKWGLYGPLMAIVLAFGAWSFYWYIMAGGVKTRLEKMEAGLTQNGYKIAHAPIVVRGYPYRMFIEIQDLKVKMPDGRGFDATLLSTEANAYALDKWVVVAPKGMVWHRGGVYGDVTVEGEALRASISHILQPIPTISLELINVKFTNSNANFPLRLHYAERFEAYLRPSLKSNEAASAKAKILDHADFLIRILGAKGQAINYALRRENSQNGADLAAQTQDFNLHLEGQLDHISAFNTFDKGQGVIMWKRANGRLNNVKASLKIVDVDAFISSDSLSLDLDNRLEGHMNIQFSGRANPIDFMKATGLVTPEYALLAERFLRLPLLEADKDLNLGLDFKGGKTKLGVIVLSKSPQILQP